MLAGDLPEPFKGLSDIGVCVVQTTEHFSVGIVSQPLTYNLAEALLYTLPGFLVAMHDCTAKQFNARRISVWLSTAHVVDFPHTDLLSSLGLVPRFSSFTAKHNLSLPHLETHNNVSDDGHGSNL